MTERIEDQAYSIFPFLCNLQKLRRTLLIKLKTRTLLQITIFQRNEASPVALWWLQGAVLSLLASGDSAVLWNAQQLEVDRALKCACALELAARAGVRFPKASLANYGRKFHWTLLVTTELATMLAFGKRTPGQPALTAHWFLWHGPWD